MNRVHAVLLLGGLAALVLGCSGGDSDGDGGSGNSGNVSNSGGSGGSGGSRSSGGRSSGGTGQVGPSPSLDGCDVFPSDNAWNRDISGLPVHANSDNFIDSVGRDTGLHPDFGTVWDGAPIGIPYVLVDDSQAPVPIDYQAYGDESTPGPFPIPLDAPIEGVGPADADGDRHVIAIDTDACMLYELYRGFPVGDGWEADSGVAWDLSSNATHPEGCTSADAAGLPIFPGLVRYDEVVERGEIRHAIRFTVSQSQRAYVAPATHYASSSTDSDRPPMGLRFRMKSDYDCSEYTDEVRVICDAMKTFGLIVADNGSNWYLSGAPDSRWSDDNLRDLRNITGDAFEVVDTGDAFVTDAPDCRL